MSFLSFQDKVLILSKWLQLLVGRIILVTLTGSATLDNNSPGLTPGAEPVVGWFTKLCIAL